MTTDDLSDYAAGLIDGLHLALDALADRLDRQAVELLVELANNLQSLDRRGMLVDGWRDDLEPRLVDLQRIFQAPPPPAQRPVAAPPQRQPLTPAPDRRKTSPPLFSGPIRPKLPFPTR